MKDGFQRLIKEHQSVVESSFTTTHLDILTQVAQKIIQAIQDNKLILICGNGGSAADSQHMAAELIGRFQQDRRSLPAIALTTDTSILTAVANDYGFERVFERQVEGLGSAGDVLIGISTSGNSQNVIRAVKKGRDLGLVTVGFAGATGGYLKDEVDLCFRAEATKTSLVQEIHIMAFHAICAVVEKAFLS